MVFLGVEEQMILGIPWLCKDNTNINWAQATMVINKGQYWISLPLVKQQDDTLTHHMDILSAKLLDKVLWRVELAKAFLEII